VLVDPTMPSSDDAPDARNNSESRGSQECSDSYRFDLSSRVDQHLVFRMLVWGSPLLSERGGERGSLL
jgi:hypothetical protein